MKDICLTYDMNNSQVIIDPREGIQSHQSEEVARALKFPEHKIKMVCLSALLCPTAPLTKAVQAVFAGCLRVCVVFVRFTQPCAAHKHITHTRKQTDTHTHMSTHTQAKKQTNKQINKQTDKQTNRQTGRQEETDK